MNCPLPLGAAVAMPGAQSSEQNQLLAALPARDYARLQPLLEPVRSRPGTVIHDAGREAHHVYFPLSGIVSVMSLTEGGGAAAMAVVGNDGMVGIGAFMGDEFTPSRAVVQSAGHGYRLAAALLKREFDHGGALHHLLLRYTQAFITQAAQTVVCTRFHSVDQRLCRCLLASLDRSPTSDLLCTQKTIAGTLGVRREAVTMAAKRLQAAGVIDYRRGHIAVLDRKNLETRSCGCYASVKQAVSHLMAAPRDDGCALTTGHRSSQGPQERSAARP